MQSELPDYEDWSDKELSDELDQVEKDIELRQRNIVSNRKSLNTFMEHRELLIDLIKQRAQKSKGWNKK
jgi:hypothetical protein